MNPVWIMNFLGPFLGGLGFYFEIPILFWVGVGIAAFTCFMNLLSGMYPFPFVELGLMLVGVFMLDPWYIGASVGLLIATAIDLFKLP
ncbi:hypothetical protein [Endozoicomonas arenosclerae]|uniref:hypothetical protein n=1 Tax=Endozoicomonas arenosclerae TaxID=1633495 RepID=UPI000785AFE2|nr:hypothetical protein [Endozoicomonas arenosclerae]